MAEFPDEYPADLLDRILRNGGSFSTLYAYRVAQYGYNNPDSYLSTLLNDRKRGARRPPNLDDLATYSTSCCTTKEAAITVKGVYFRKMPEAEIAEGEIRPELGPSRIDENSTHINWWLFKDAAPWLYFKRTEV